MSILETFIYEGVEVALTGRTAEKTSKTLAGKEPRVFVLHEISPVDSFAGQWRKWVAISDLFKVKTL